MFVAKPNSMPYLTVAAPTQTTVAATPALSTDVIVPQETVAASPENAVEPSLGSKLKKAFFEQKREGNMVHSSPFNRVTFAAVCAAGAWTTAKIASNLIADPSLGAVVGAAAGLGAGYMAADVVSGMLHHWADNYADPESKNQFTRKFAQQSQRHHYHPTGLSDYSISGWAAPLSVVSWAPLAAATALNLPTPVLAATLSLVGGTSIYGVFHQYSHKPESKTPKFINLLQKAGLAISRKNHGRHHALPWNSDFCIVSGQMNKVFDKINFWPKYEKAIFKLTGKQPESWKVPEYKAFVFGEMSKEEYISKSKEIRQNFRTTEYNERKQKWGIDQAPATPVAAPAVATPEEKKAPEQTERPEVDFNGTRPAHRNVKKLVRGAAALVGAAGIGKIAYDIVSSPTLETGLAKGALSLGVTAAAVVGIDVASGVGHHFGDNYGLPRPQSLQHTKWHTDVASTDYCLVGISNKALDKIGFWPAWEKALHTVAGKTPVSWQVPAYKSYALGEIDKATLQAELAKAGLKHTEA